MQTKALREGSVGLMIAGGAALLVGTLLWLKGNTFDRNRYNLVVRFSNAAGIQIGTPVAFRGVPVGQVSAITPGSNDVAVTLDITPGTLALPRQMSVKAQSSSLLGNPSLILNPKRDVVLGTGPKYDPRSRECDRRLILCNGEEIAGESSPTLGVLITTLSELAKDAQRQKMVSKATAVLEESRAAARRIEQLAADLRQQVPAAGKTIRSIGAAADSVTAIATTNRSEIRTTLTNISQASGELRLALADLRPAISDVRHGKLVQNLNATAANLAKATKNVSDVTTALNTPENVLLLQQTLDSARATFQNAQKITSDLDRLTGNPLFVESLKRLVIGLSGLISSTERLDQNVRVLKTAQAQLP
mgnify:CR=1 FL=1